MALRTFSHRDMSSQEGAVILLENKLVETSIQFVFISLIPERKIRTVWDMNKEEAFEDSKLEVYRNRVRSVALSTKRPC